MRPGAGRKAALLIILGAVIEFASNYVPPMPFNEQIGAGLTLAAMLVLGGTAIWVVRGLGRPGIAARMVVVAVCLVVLSELMSVFETIPYLNRVSLFQGRNPIHLSIENAMTNVGLVLLLAGFLVSAVEGHSMRQVLEARNEALRLEAEERARAEEALRENEENFRALAENAFDGILVLDEEGRHLYANPQMERLTGYVGSEWLSATLEDLAHPDDAPQLRERLAKRLRGEDAPKQYETRLIRKDGVCVPIELAASKTMWRGTIADLIFVRDLTERKRAAHTISAQQLNLVAASKLSSLGAMTSGVAHEINNPLAVIGAAAEQLARFFAMSHPREDHMVRATTSISRNATRIENIVRGLRSISRDGSSDPFYPTALKAIVQDTLELCRERIRAHQIDLRIADIPEGIEVECRATQISQVLMNLLNNAFDALEQQDEKWVRVEFRDADGAVELAVVDSGEAPPVNVQERIFEPFFTSKLVGKGTGLGLSIARSIVEDHGGHLILDEASRHTRFIVRLPKRRPRKGPEGTVS